MANTATPKEQVQQDTQKQASTPKLFGTGNVADKFTAATAQGIKYERTAFMEDSAPGLIETTNGNKDRTEKVATNVVEFSPQLVEGIKMPIMAHFERIVELQNMEITDPDTGLKIKAYDRIRDESMENHDPTFMLEQSMLALITTDGHVDKKKIDQLAGDPRFMEAAMRILMRKKRDILEAVGVREVINPRGKRANLLNTGRTITLGVDQGRINDAYQQFSQWWGDSLHVAGRDTNLTHGGVVNTGAYYTALAGTAAAALGGVAGGLMAGPMGALAGVKIGAVAGEAALGIGAAAWRSARQPGLQVNFERRQDLLDAARARASVRDEFLYGIDPKDFVLTADGRGIQIDPARLDPGQSIHTTNLEGSFQQAIQILALQQMYAEALHIDPKKFESETQYIHEPKADFARGSAPQTGEKMATDIHREYTTLLKLAQDKARDVGTNLNEASFDVQSRLFNQAEATVIQRRLEAIMKEPVKTQETRRSENLDKKANSFTKGSPEFDARTKKDTEGKARAEKDKQVYTGEGQKLTAYKTELDAVTAKRDALKQKLADVAVGTAYPDVKTAVKDINELIDYDPASGATTPANISAFDTDAGQRVDITPLKKQELDAYKAYQSALSDIPTTVPKLAGEKDSDWEVRKQAAKVEAKRKYDEKVTAINHQRKLLKGLLSELQTEESQLKQAEAATATSPTSTEGRTTLENFSNDYDRLRRLGITEARLKGDDVDAIMRDINNAALRGNRDAWDDTGNTMEANRAIVLNAMAEQRTKDILSRSINRATQEPIFADALVLGITEHQLRVSSPEDLKKLYDDIAPKAHADATSVEAARAAELTTANTNLATASAAVANARADIITLRAALRAATTPADIATARDNLRIGVARRMTALDAEAVARTARDTADRLATEAATRLTQVTTANSRLVGGPPLTIPITDIEGAKAWAYERLSAHQEALSNRTGEIDRDITTLDRRINAADASLGAAREQINRTKELVTQWENGDMQTRVTSIMFEEDERNKLLDTTNTGAATSTSTEPLTQAQGYTEAEIASNLTRGELALLNMITGYQKPEADRAKRFAEVQKLFNVATNPGNFQALVEAFENFVPTSGTPAITLPTSTIDARKFAANAMTTRTGFTWRTPTSVNDLLTVISPLLQNRDFDAFEMYRIMGLFTTKMYQSTMAL